MELYSTVTSSVAASSLERRTNSIETYRLDNSLNKSLLDTPTHNHNSSGLSNFAGDSLTSHTKDYLSIKDGHLAGYKTDKFLGWVIAAALVIWGIVVLAKDCYSLPQQINSSKYSPNNPRKKEEAKDDLAARTEYGAETYKTDNNSGVLFRVTHKGKSYFVRANEEFLKQIKDTAKNRGDLEKTLEEDREIENPDQSYLTRRLKGYEVKDEKEDRGDYNTRKEDRETETEEIADENLKNEEVAEAGSDKVEADTETKSFPDSE